MDKEGGGVSRPHTGRKTDGSEQVYSPHDTVYLLIAVYLDNLY